MQPIVDFVNKNIETLLASKKHTFHEIFSQKKYEEFVQKNYPNLKTPLLKEDLCNLRNDDFFNLTVNQQIDAYLEYEITNFLIEKGELDLVNFLNQNPTSENIVFGSKIFAALSSSYKRRKLIRINKERFDVLSTTYELKQNAQLFISFIGQKRDIRVLAEYEAFLEQVFSMSLIENHMKEDKVFIGDNIWAIKRNAFHYLVPLSFY